MDRVSAKEIANNSFTKLKGMRQSLQKIGIIIGAAILLYQIIQYAINIWTREVVIYQPKYLFLAAMIFIVAIFQQMLAWKLILHAINVDIPMVSVLESYVVSFLPRYIPGSVWGYMSRAEWLSRLHKVRYGDTNFASAIEIVVGLFSCVLIIGLYRFTEETGNGRLIPLVETAVIMAFFWIIILLVDKIGTSIFFSGHAIDKCVRGFRILESLVLFFVNNYFYGVGMWFVSQAFSLQAARLDLSEWFSFSAFYSLAWVIGFLIIFVPAGVGVREVVLTMLLFTKSGMPLSMANGVAVVMRLCVLLSEAVWVMGGFLLGKFKKKIKDKKERK